VGSSGVNRKRRDHLPEVQQDDPAPLGRDHGAYTIEGNVERMGDFARGVNRRRGAARPVTRMVVGAFVLLLLVAMLVPIIARVF
jgi:hypothetical protein